VDLTGEAASHPIPPRDRPEPGRLTAVTVGEQVIAVANVGGTYYAFQDACTHEECPLSDGDLDGHVVICHCHGGEFDVRTGKPLDGPVYRPLRTFGVTGDGGDVRLML